MSGLPKVLVVEDNEMLQRMFARKLEGKATVLAARTVEEARQLFAENPDVRVIALDGYLSSALDGDRPIDTLPLIGEFRETFTGTMIAMATFPGHRQEMTGAGCDFQICEKRMLTREVEILLGC